MSNVEAGSAGLGRRSITAVLWGTGGAVIRGVMQLLSQILLARMLGPELYGLFAVALVVVLMSGLLADVGLAYGLIQKETVSDEDVRFVFTWQVILGISMMLALWAGAPYLGSIFSDPRVGPVIAALAPICLVNATAATSGALLKREMDFRAINTATVISYAFGYFVVAIPLALAGQGVMALVAGFVAQAATASAIQYAYSRHAIRPLLWQPHSRRILDFGVTVLLTNLINWAISGTDRAIVGMALGLQSAGLYTIAHNLISTPLMTGLSLLQSVLYTASAKVQDDKARLARAFTTIIATVVLFAAPVLTGIAMVSDTVFHVLYGAKWTGGGAVLMPLSLAMIAFLVMGLATPVLWASGATRRELELQIPVAVVWIGALAAVAASGSLIALSWVVCALVFARAAVLVWAVLAATELPARRLLAASRAGIAVNLLVALTALAVDGGLAPLIGRSPVLLAIDIAACALAVFAGLRLQRSRIDSDVRELMVQLAERVPGGRGTKVVTWVLGRG